MLWSKTFPVPSFTNTTMEQLKKMQIMFLSTKCSLWWVKASESRRGERPSSSNIWLLQCCSVLRTANWSMIWAFYSPVKPQMWPQTQRPVYFAIFWDKSTSLGPTQNISWINRASQDSRPELGLAGCLTLSLRLEIMATEHSKNFHNNSDFRGFQHTDQCFIHLH